MDWSEFSEHLNQALAESALPPIQIITAHEVAGGDSHTAYQLHTEDKNYFLKLSPAQNALMLATEMHSLQAISNSQTINCPTAILTGIYQQYAWLLMDFIPLTQQGDDFQRGRDLAFLHHQINRTTKPFGWFEDNFIGQNLQQNRWQFDWVNFYGQQRLLPQLELAQLRGASPELYQSGITLIEQLPYWFQDYQAEPSLLHGDLWAENSAFDSSGTALFFDPACYYGDRETDIAMTELFGGFSPEFYAGYQDLFPLDKGYQQRKPLYNLYHILNHFNLFSGHYEQQAHSLIQQLLQQAQSPKINS
ncbi:MAG: protein-ribulosamine 3-kinase [Thiomicrorhabdus sp.]|nr:MAG: protein-ribulosamine 3-kinase [Thiomicrorhabdus sp.]